MSIILQEPHTKGVIPENYDNNYISNEEIEEFQKDILSLLDYISENPNVKEEPVKNTLTTFLNKIYKGKYNVAVPPSDSRVDLQIYDGKSAKDPVAVIIETKKPGALKSEMIYMDEVSKTCNLNVKAFHELIGYYLDFQEQNKGRLNNLRHLVVTDVNNWFIFFENDFYDNLLKRNKEIRELHQRCKVEKKIERFYEELEKINYLYDDYNWRVIHFNFSSYKKELEKKDVISISPKFFQLYKLLSPYVLLGKSLPINDSNALNKKFYRELLHILGLVNEDEENDAGKIKRLPEGKRNSGSLIENIIMQLELKSFKLDGGDFANYGRTKEEQQFNIALDLLITWLNRILFIKLLEGQLMRYGKLTEKFLTWENIKNYRLIHQLFFQVLKLPIGERTPHIAEKYGQIPYLNSSLFDITDLEDKFITIDNLDEIELPYYHNSILTHKNHETIESCKYLLQFLDAYDFASDQSKIFKNENKDKLINASVLGLIFEKINAYADGAVFTPGNITSYICKETIRRAVVKKFNESSFPGAGKFKTIENIADTDVLRFGDHGYQGLANEIINSIRICDPAVGSGHFLVSALNELMLIKSELRILMDKQGTKRLGVGARIINDELIFDDLETGNQFKYNPNDKSGRSQVIQEGIFNEKYGLITKCLYGVDINPKSVSICRLRLWIELLKHAYYKGKWENHNFVTSSELVVLPNIDVNVRVGNSLLSQISLDTPYSKLEEEGLVPNINEYKNLNSAYRTASKLNEKHELKRKIDAFALNRRDINIKEKILESAVVKCQKFVKEIEIKLEQKTLDDLFGSSESRTQLKKEYKNAKRELKDAEAALIDYKKDNSGFEDAVLSNAFEWRYEFPDILDADGTYHGFDCIVGNPPYFSISTIKDDIVKEYYANFKTYTKGSDIYCLFYELGWKLITVDGYLGYITSNSWMRAAYGKTLRKFFVSETNPEILVDCANLHIFDKAVNPNILILQKSRNKFQTSTCICKRDLSDLSNYIKQHSQPQKYTSENAWLIVENPIALSIKNKIEAIGKPTADWGLSIIRGVSSGLSDAFIISGNKRLEILESCKTDEEKQRTEALICPLVIGDDVKRYYYEYMDRWLIATFPSRKYDIDNYPAVKEYLLNNFGMKRLEQTGKKYNIDGLKIEARREACYKWFETQDPINHWEDFGKKKILVKIIGSNINFCYDTTGIYCNNAVNIVVADEDLMFKYLGLMNSKLYDWYLKLTTEAEVLGKGIQLYPSTLLKTIINLDFDSSFVDIIRARINNGKINDGGVADAEIDNIVFDLYNLSEDEKEYVLKNYKQNTS